jgi:hypothetical protein
MTELQKAKLVEAALRGDKICKACHESFDAKKPWSSGTFCSLICYSRYQEMLRGYENRSA